MNVKYKFIMIVSLVLPFIFFKSCTKENPTEPVSDLIFLEHLRKVNGVLIEGKYYEGPYMERYINYDFNAQDRKIECHNMDFDVNQVNILYGYEISLSGLSGSGMMNHLYGINQLPTTIDKLEINNLNDFGTIIIKYKEKLFELKINEEWTDTSSVISIQDVGKARIITEDVIKNYGVISRNNVTR
ncbi:MAG: hypothetical protein PHW79_11290 [Candidatus Marinimicrobia bacterium]|nr:hypothetical protein [Candidatus Neomarinimicrobiota bacterium]